MRWRSIPIQVPDRQFLTMKQVAAYVGVDRKVIREWVRVGTFPPPEVVAGMERWENKAVGLWLELRRYMPSLDVTAGRPRPGRAEPRREESEGAADGPELAARRHRKAPGPA